MYGIKINKLPLHQRKGNTMIVKPFDIKNFNVYDIVKVYVERKYKLDITETIGTKKLKDGDEPITLKIEETFEIANNPNTCSRSTSNYELIPELVEIAKELYEIKKEATIAEFEKLNNKLDFIYEDDKKWAKTKENFKYMLYCECNSVMYQILSRISSSRSMENLALKQRVVIWDRENIPEKPTCN